MNPASLDPERWQKIQQAFLDAVEMKPLERESWVRTNFGKDEDAAETVLRMLTEDGEDNSLIDQGLAAIAVATLEDSREPFASLNFGPYKPLELLGEGGMGVVYLAQNPHTGQRVAIKILLDARLSPARRARFDQEQKMLAALEHRNIARLYYADILPNGTPWFAMEYVGAEPGHEAEPPLPITEYCRQNRLSMEARLRLFRTVCEAVQYVHGKMLVHRDLKPSNILVTGEGVVKLIDFGIGKGFGEESSLERTAPGLRLMTLEYAAPEQIRGADALPSTDVYSLGVVLYELLTDGHPYDLSHCSAFEAERILTSEPLRNPSLAARTTPSAPVVSRSEWKDLDALCLKAMHKDPERRYGSAEAIIGDLDNFLASRPLTVRRQRWSYVASRFVRRNRRLLLLSGLAAASLIALTTFYTISLQRARDAALNEKARTDRVVEFVLEMIKNNDDEVGPSQDMKVSELVARGLKNAEKMSNDPEVQADLYDTFGGIYQTWGQSEKAYKLLEAGWHERQKSFGEDSPEAAESLEHMAVWKNEQDELPTAEHMLLQVLEIQRRHLKPDDHALELTYTALGLVQQRLGRYPESIANLAKAIAIGQKHSDDIVDLGAAVSLQANNYYYQGNYGESERLNREGLELDRRIHGNSHPDIADDLINLGNIEQEREDYAQSERDFRQAYEITRAWYGPDHVNVADNEIYLSRALTSLGRYAESYSYLQHALRVLERPEHAGSRTRMALAYDGLAKIAAARKQFDEQRRDLDKAVEIYTAVHGPDHPNTLIVRGNRADLMITMKQYPQAERELRSIQAAYQKLPSVEPKQIGEVHLRLGRLMRLENRLNEAESELLTGIKQIGGQIGSNVSWIRNVQGDLAQIYMARGENQSSAEKHAAAVIAAAEKK